MYNYETEREDGGEGGGGELERENKRKQKREGRGGGKGERVFYVSPEFERPPFHVSIVIFSMFSFHLLHLSSRDKDITLSAQGGQYRRVHECVL